MSIYSNDNIRKIAKLTTRELPQKSKNAKITVRENNGLYSTSAPRLGTKALPAPPPSHSLPLPIPTTYTGCPRKSGMVDFRYFAS